MAEPLPFIRADYDGDTLLGQYRAEFTDGPYKDRDDIPLTEFGIFWLFFILQTIVFAVIAYLLHIGYFDEKFFRTKSKVPFYSHLYKEIEQEYEKSTASTPGRTRDKTMD